MKFAGIDYSLSSPAVCIFDDKQEFSFNNCQFHILSDKKTTNVDNINKKKHSEWNNRNERYHDISHFFLEELISCDVIYIEDYSMRSIGKVFHIAENTEVLLYNLWLNKKEYTKIPPTVLKKFASGKGAGKKELMYDAFVKQTKLILTDMMGVKNYDSPVSDIIDSFFLCAMAMAAGA